MNLISMSAAPSVISLTQKSAEPFSITRHSPQELVEPLSITFTSKSQLPPLTTFTMILVGVKMLDDVNAEGVLAFLVVVSDGSHDGGVVLMLLLQVEEGFE